MTQSTFQGIDSESTHDSSRSPDIDLDRLMSREASLGIKSNWLVTQNASPILDRNRLVTQAKNIWFGVDSWFDSESCLCLESTKWCDSPICQANDRLVLFFQDFLSFRFNERSSIVSIYCLQLRFSIEKQPEQVSREGNFTNCQITTWVLKQKRRFKISRKFQNS